MGKNGRVKTHVMDRNMIRKFPYDFGQEFFYRESVKCMPGYED